jgi:hypothetical protein
MLMQGSFLLSKLKLNCNFENFIKENQYLNFKSVNKKVYFLNVPLVPVLKHLDLIVKHLYPNFKLDFS